MSSTTSDYELSITNNEKALAGILMVLAIIISILTIIMHWPDKMPTAENTAYFYTPFRITLIENHTPNAEQLAAAIQAAKDRLKEDQKKVDALTQVKTKADNVGDNIIALKAVKRKRFN